MVQNKISTSFIFALIFGFLVAACEEETTWVLQKSEPIIIVDAIITNELKAQEVKVYWSVQELNDLPEPISDAEVKISLGNIVYNFTESQNEPGLYLSTAFAAAYDQIYKLEIEFNDLITEAYASGEYISALRPDTVVENGELNQYVYTGSDKPAMTEIYYDWSHSSEFCNEYGSCFASETFYTLNIIDIGEEFSPDKQEILFPFYTTITRRKYSLSSEHQEFIRSLLIETEWRGGLFDVEYGNVPTNFSNNVRGWFGVCMVLEDTKTILE